MNYKVEIWSNSRTLLVSAGFKNYTIANNYVIEILKEIEKEYIICIKIYLYNSWVIIKKVRIQ